MLKSLQRGLSRSLHNLNFPGAVCVLINGGASNLFVSSRGLHQGCPLSPYLFLLVAEGLSRILIDARCLGRIKGIGFGDDFNITYLLFVDDVLLITNGSIQEGTTLSGIWSLYYKSTGVITNKEIFAVFFSNVELEQKQLLQNLIGFNSNDLQDGIKYIWYSLKPCGYKKEGWDQAYGGKNKFMVQ